MDNASRVLYEDFMKKIKDAVDQGLPFDEACSLIAVRDAGVRESVINDALKAVIAEMHFSRGLPLKNLAMRLRVSLSRLLKAKEGMHGGSRESRICKTS